MDVSAHSDGEADAEPDAGGGAQSLNIYDVAGAAGVSYQTVSRVINGAPNVKHSTREHVLATITRLGYRPEPGGQGAGGRPGPVGDRADVGHDAVRPPVGPAGHRGGRPRGRLRDGGPGHRVRAAGRRPRRRRPARSCAARRSSWSPSTGPGPRRWARSRRACRWSASSRRRPGPKATASPGSGSTTARRRPRRPRTCSASATGPCTTSRSRRCRTRPRGGWPAGARRWKGRGGGAGADPGGLAPAVGLHGRAAARRRSRGHRRAVRERRPRARRDQGHARGRAARSPAASASSASTTYRRRRS